MNEDFEFPEEELELPVPPPPEDRPKISLLGLIQERTEARGLVCPKCESPNSTVYYVRKASGGRTMRRRRCQLCGNLYSTVEKAA